MIANQTYDHSFYDIIHEWLRVGDCFAGECSTLSHFGRFCSRGNNKNCHMLEHTYCEDEGDDRHDSTVYDWTIDLTEMDRSSKIAKCVRVSDRFCYKHSPSVFSVFSVCHFLLFSLLAGISLMNHRKGADKPYFEIGGQSTSKISLSEIPTDLHA